MAGAKHLYRDHAVVLRTWKLGESDRIVSLMTAQNGKIRAVAKGVRKTRSRLGARAEPITHGAVQLYRGRELDILTQVEIVDSFVTVRSDLVRLGRGAVMLESIDHVAMERQPNPGLYRLLLGALRTLETGDRPLLLAGFLLKLLVQEGVQPQMGACVVCGDTAHLRWFDVVSGGVRCEGCRGGVLLPDGAVPMMASIVDGRLRDVIHEPASPVTDAIERASTAMLERHLERRLRSPSVAADSTVVRRI